MLVRREIGTDPPNMVPGRWARYPLRLRSAMTRSKRNTIRNRRSRLRVIYVLEAGMAGNVRRGHGRRALMRLLCLLSLFGSGCGLVFFVIVIAFA